MLSQSQSLSPCGLTVRGCVLHFERPFAANLEAVMHRGSRREIVGAKTGGRIIHFQFMNCLSAVVFNPGVYPIALAGNGIQHTRTCNYGPECFLKIFHWLPFSPVKSS